MAKNKDSNKEVSMMKLKIDDALFRGFKASRYLENLELKFNDKVKKILLIVLIVLVIELSGHGIFASLIRFLNSLN